MTHIPHGTPEFHRMMSERQRGENHWHAKLTDAQVRELYAAKGRISATEAAKLVEDVVSTRMVYRIWHGQAWSHVTGERERNA